MCRNARAARGHSGRPDAGRSGGGARFSARCRGPGSLRHRNSDKQSGCPGENRSRYRGDVRQGQSRCGSRSMAGSEPTPVAAELCHAWLILRTRPVLLEPGAVLAAVKDAARRTSERWPAAILDCCCARPPAGRQAGTKKRPPVSRTKKHDEVGNTGLPSKGVSLLPMINSEEASIETPRSASLAGKDAIIGILGWVFRHGYAKGRPLLHALENEVDAIGIRPHHATLPR